MGTVLAVSSALLVVMSLAGLLMTVLIRSGLERNELVGLRTAATKASDEAWSAGHEAARPVLLALTAIGALLAITTGLAYLMTRPVLWPAVLVAAPGAAFTIGVLVYATLVANRAARRPSS